MSSTRYIIMTKLRNPLEWDRKLFIIVALVLAFIIFVIAMFGTAFAYMYKFRGFRSDVQHCIARIKTNFEPEVTVDGVSVKTDEHDWKRFSYYIRTMKPGKEQKEFPGDESENVLKIVFRDGQVMEICETDIPEKTRLRDKGICIRYTGSDGKVILFDTDQYGYETFRALFE
jgi:hypothetical protein